MFSTYKFAIRWNFNARGASQPTLKAPFLIRIKASSLSKEFQERYTATNIKFKITAALK